MGFGIVCVDLNNAQHGFEIPHYPDMCPICHHAIHINAHHFAYYDAKKLDANNCIQILFRCPRVNCQNLFIAYYSRNRTNNLLAFSYSQPTTFTGRTFSEVIKQLSPEFCEIYNQSLSAETSGLRKICGVGYRKSLEFLIKDYLIKSNPAKEQEIKGKFLGKCIAEDISSEQIKAVARRATWLGNDEAHYSRVWEGKDLQDLKKLIDLTVHWIEMEELTKEAVKDMPDK